MAKTSQRRRSSVKKEFSDKELQELKTAFQLLDSNRDGHVEFTELKTMLNNLGINLDDDKIMELIKNASHSGNQLIDENDFLNWIKKIEYPDSNGEEDDGSKELLAAFQVFDLDKNGFITRDELRTALEMIGESVSEEQLTEFITLADTDKDGRINYEEFAKLLL